MAPAPSLRFDALLAHEPLVRATARAILKGDPEVDDVVQDTWLAALREGPRDDRAAPGWLRQVARHRALNVLRDRRRRIAREQAVHRTEWAPDVAAIKERESVRCRLIEVLLEQPEPYRAALLMRFYDDLPPRRIARQLGVPVETVKTRIRRGLARMRLSLGVDFEDRSRTSRGTVLGLSGLANWNAAASRWWMGGALLVSKQTVVIVAFVVLFLAGVVWIPPALRSDAPTDAVTEPESAADAETKVARARPHLTPQSTPADVGPSWPPGSVRGVVVDVAGAPLGGVGIHVVNTDQEHEGSLQRREPLPGGETFVARTDTDGRFALADGPGTSQVLLAAREGFEVARVTHNAFEKSSSKPARIVLHRGRVIEGHVKSRDGDGIPGARVTVMARSSADTALTGYMGTTDATGAFRFRFVPASGGWLGAQAHGYGTARQDLGLGAEVTLVLERSALLVRVIDDDTGKAISDAGAVIRTPDGGFQIGLSRLTQTFWGAPHPPGWLSLLAFQGEHAFPHPEGILFVVAPGYETAEVPIRRDPTKEPPVVTVRLGPGASHVVLAGTVRGGPQALLELRVPRPAAWLDSGDAGLPLLATAVAGADGTFEIAGIPSGAYRLVALADGLPPKSVSVDVPDRGVVIDLSPGGALDVRVEPPSPAWVHVEQPGGRAFWARQADAEGLAVFDDLPPGPYRATIVPAESRGRILPYAWMNVPVRASVEVNAGERAKLRLRVPAPNPVTLEIVDENGSPRPGVRVKVTAQPGSYAERARGADGMRIVRDSRHTAGEDGRVALRLYVGTYSLALEQDAQKRQTWLRVTSPGEQVRTIAFARGTRTLRGQVLDAETGEGIPGRRVEITDAGAKLHELIGFSATDETGRFEVEALPAQRVVVSIVTNLSPERTPVPKNGYGNASLHVDLTQGDLGPVIVKIWETKRWIEAAGSVELSVHVTDAEDESSVAGGSVSVEVLNEGSWTSGFWGRLGDDGRLAKPLLVPRADRYRFSVHGGFSADPPYERRTVECEPKNGRAEIEVALKRLGG